jgi:hypothetical protein
MSERERERAQMGRASGWAERRQERREAARVADFIFFFFKNDK